MARTIPTETEETAATIPAQASTLTADEIDKLDAYWRAANYLSVGQIYLYDNPLLKEPLKATTSSRACSAIGARLPG